MINNVENIATFINVVFTITSKWWDERTLNGITEIHRGLDIATGSNDTVYSILNGVIHSKGYDESMGNWVIIHDNQVGSQTYGYATLYMHLRDSVTLAIGTLVSKNEPIGIEGDTGYAFGIHLHVEMQDISRFNNQWHWSYVKSDYLDPTLYMGIENTEGTRWLYDGSPTPPIPTENKKHHYKFYLFKKNRF